MTQLITASPVITAVLLMVNEETGGNPTLYDADSPRDAVGKYAVMYPDVGRKSSEHRDLLGVGPHELRYQITSVGVSREQASWVHDRIAEALLTLVPVVAGRRCWPAIQESAQNIRRDSTSTNLWFGTAQYLTRSDAA